MEFRIADTFTDSLARLTGEEQKAVKTTAFDLQLNPAHPSLQFHKLDRAKDKNFWSIRVSGDIRLIVHRTGSSLLLCYVDHHDNAYDWAERRKLETHPKTGAAQLVEIRQTVREITIPKVAHATDLAAPAAKAAGPQLFGSVSDDHLLGYGVPPEWLPDVRRATEDSILDLVGHLPAEAAEALLNLATGTVPQLVQQILASSDALFAPAPRTRSLPSESSAVSTASFEHPDARRRFRLIHNLEELERALEYPWEKWTIFLHPAQRQLVEKEYGGPARVAGSAGTGKTIVALHRAVHLARKHSHARVLLTTFSDALANVLRTKLRQLIANEPRLGERIEIQSMISIGERLYSVNIGKLQIASPDAVLQAMQEAAQGVKENKFSLYFVKNEWDQVVDAWQLETWESYRDVARLGRRTRLKEPQRAILWTVFERLRASLQGQKIITHSEMFNALAKFYAAGASSPFEFVVIDEAQDVSIAQLRFLAALGASRQNRLFFAGDLGQRIFQQPFSWRSLGVDVRGRSTILRINYRTSHQIRTQADRLLGPVLSDVDGISEQRNTTVSLFNGPAPQIEVLQTTDEECRRVSEWLKGRVAEGLLPHEIAIFVRSAAELPRARAAVERGGVPSKMLDDHVEVAHGKLSISTMHLAKGLEFRAVVVMACDDEIVPLQERIQTVTDDSDLEDVYNTERQLLYVACTRARDHLLVTSVAPASEFLDDLRA